MRGAGTSWEELLVLWEELWREHAWMMAVLERCYGWLKAGEMEETVS